MAFEGVVIGADFDTAKAEAKMRKLQREYDIAKKKVENKKIEIDMATVNADKIYSDLNKISAEIKEKEIEIKETLKWIDYYEQKGSVTGVQKEKEKLSIQQAELEKLKELEIKKNQLLDSETFKIQKQEIELEKLKNKQVEIGEKIALNGKKQNKFTQAFEKSQKSADRFGKRLKSLIASALFFSVVTKAFTALRNEFGKLITETGTKTASLVSQLKSNLATIGRTLYESARPYIEWVLQSLVKMTNILANGLAKILGKNINEMRKLAQQTKKAGEEAKKASASFDTLQTVDTSSSNSGSGVGADYSAITDAIDNEMVILMAVASGALLVLGVILTFTGANIPLGLGLIAIGAVGLASSLSANWDTMTSETRDAITSVMAIGGALFILLGIALLISGVGIPLGLGLILMGAGMLYGAISLSPGDTFVEKVKNLWENCKKVTKDFINWFSENVLDGIFGESFGDTLDGMFDNWTYLWEDMISFFDSSFKGDWEQAGKDLLNVFIDLINLFTDLSSLPIVGVIGLISKMASWAGKLFNKNWEFDTSWAKPIHIPRLATGAILPGGSPMLAWVNDQPKGQPYVEGSIDNIAAAFEKYLGDKNFGNQNLTIEAKGNWAQFIKFMNLEIKKESNRASVWG